MYNGTLYSYVVVFRMEQSGVFGQKKVIHKNQMLSHLPYKMIWGFILFYFKYFDKKWLFYAMFILSAIIVISLINSPKLFNSLFVKVIFFYQSV